MKLALGGGFWLGVQLGTCDYLGGGGKHCLLNNLFHFYPRQELLSGIVVSGKKFCPSGGRMGGRAAGRHAFVSGPLWANY